MSHTAAKRTLRAVNLDSVDGSAYPERIVVSSEEVAPFILHLTFGKDNSISRASVSARRVRGDGRAYGKKVVTAPVDASSGWVMRVAYMNAPIPTEPGRYARYSERNMTYPNFFSLSAHGVWYSADGVVQDDDIPSSLIAR